MYDVIVIGCGPAGLSTAINCKIRNKEVIVFGGEVCSPKLYGAHSIKNYLGIIDIKGEELRDRFLEHAGSLGIPIKNTRVDGITSMGDYFSVLVKQDVYEAKAVVLAMGVMTDRKLKGEDVYLGKGVSYCGTCDGFFFRDKDVAVIAYTKEEGIYEANYLSEICRNCYFIPMYKDDEKEINENIKVINDNPLDITGDGNLVTGLKLKNQDLKVDGVFVIRESIPPSQLVLGLEIKDKHINVERNMETNIKGLYAAGDCTGAPYQISKAVGEGQIAALEACRYISTLT